MTGDLTNNSNTVLMIDTSAMSFTGTLSLRSDDGSSLEAIGTTGDIDDQNVIYTLTEVGGQTHVFSRPVESVLRPIIKPIP